MLEFNFNFVSEILKREEMKSIIFNLIIRYNDSLKFNKFAVKFLDLN